MKLRELRRKQEKLVKKEENKIRKNEEIKKMRRCIQKLPQIALESLRNNSMANHTIDSVHRYLPYDIHTVIMAFIRYKNVDTNRYAIDITPRTLCLFKLYKLNDNCYLRNMMETIPVDKLEKYVRRGSAKIYYKKCYNTSIYLENKEELKKDKWYKSYCYSSELSRFMVRLHESINTDGYDYFKDISKEEKAKMLENLLLSFIFVHRKYSTAPLNDYF